MPGIRGTKRNSQGQAIGIPRLRQKVPGVCMVLLRWGERGVVGLAWGYVVVLGRSSLATMCQFQQAALVHAELHSLAHAHVMKRFLRDLHTCHTGLGRDHLLEHYVGQPLHPRQLFDADLVDHIHLLRGQGREMG